MRDIKEFVDLLDLVFNKPPRNIPELSLKSLAKYPTEFVFSKLEDKIIAGVMIVKLGDNIYGIENMVVHPDYQGKGYGTQLMDLTHKKYKGLFLLRTREAKGFYKKFGYIPINDREMVYSNKEIIDF